MSELMGTEEDTTARHPGLNLAGFLLWVVAALFLANFLVLVFLYPFYGDHLLLIGTAPVSGPDEHPEFWSGLMFMQGFISFFSLISAPFLYLAYFYKPGFSRLRLQKMPSPAWLLAAVVFTLVLMPFNGWLADINQAMKLPGFLQGFESWAASKEAELRGLTDYLTRYHSDAQLWAGILVIAAIPAIGEELTFRGVIQNILKDWFGNIHIAIVVTGILFSAIHVQFYGFLPRAVLGILFGYVYYWGNNLWLPVACHFVNNLTTLLLIHWKNKGTITIDLETTRDLPVWSIVLSFLFSVGILYMFYRYGSTRFSRIETTDQVGV